MSCESTTAVNNNATTHAAAAESDATIPDAADDVDATLQQRLAELEATVRELRGLITQHRTPTPCKSKLIRRDIKVDVLSIVGDGRCLFYSLLQSQHSMLPTAGEADALRQLLRTRLLEHYTDEQWAERVPIHCRDIITRQQFAERYLTCCTDHVPNDVAALWQDIQEQPTDVYILERTPDSKHQSEQVELISSSVAATHAVLLRFTWRHGVGHYELLMVEDLLRLPVRHKLVQHLDQLHEQHVEELGARKKKRRAALNEQSKQSKRQRTNVDVVDLVHGALEEQNAVSIFSMMT